MTGTTVAGSTSKLLIAGEWVDGSVAPSRC